MIFMLLLNNKDSVERKSGLFKTKIKDLSAIEIIRTFFCTF